MTITDGVRPLAGYEPLLDRVGNARFVLLGEASHGTHEFYRERAEITKQLIAEHGFTAVAAEADWPDAYRVNLYVRGASDDLDAEEALQDFKRFPAWMWRNTDIVDFVEWLREWNDGLPPAAQKVGVYGLDLYSLYTSLEAVVSLLDDIDPDAAHRARERYSCFDHFGRDPQLYAYAALVGDTERCERAAVDQLVEIQRLAAQANDDADPDRLFYAEQNARLVVNAEEYYRAAFRANVDSWNLRDRHMAETLDALTLHLERTQGPAKVAVWAHNSHVGDARATDMGTRGELNIGQLVRVRHGRDAFIVGFTTYTGTVTAASDWGGLGLRKNVVPARSDSWEALFHEAGETPILLDARVVEGRRLERAIGVIYRPETERMSHYFYATLADQFDAVIHFDETRAVEPLEPTSEWVEGELPETFPFGV